MIKRILIKIAMFVWTLAERMKRKAEWVEYQKLRRQFKRIGQGSIFPFMDYQIIGAENIEIGDSCHFGHRVRLCAYNDYLAQSFKPNLSIGNGVSICNDIHIGCIDSIKIGNRVLMASRITILDHFHGNITCEDINTPPI